MLSSMEIQNTMPRERVGQAESTSSESAYEDSWYRVLKRLADEGDSDDADAGGDDAGGR